MAARARTSHERREAVEARRARRAEVTDLDVVMEAAAAFLAVRPRSVKETRQRLRGLGYPVALCDGVVDRLIEVGYLDDHAFATAWVESRDRARPRGQLALRRELQLKGVPNDTIAAVLDSRDEAPGVAEARDGGTTAGSAGADVAVARRLLERRSASLLRESDPRRLRQHAYALLAGRGFTPDVCAEVSAAFVTQHAEHDGGAV